MSGGLVNDAEKIAYTCTTAVSYAGLLVKGSTSASTVDLCGAGEEPVGYTFTNTKDPITGVAAAATKVGIVALIPGQIAEFKLVATNATIAIGDKLETTAAGTVDKKSDAGWIVGDALAAAASNDGTYIKARVYKYYASS